MHSKENLQNQDLGAGCPGDTSGPRAPTLAFRSRANLSITSYSQKANVSSSQTLFSYELLLSRYRRAVTRYFGSLAKVVVYRLLLRRRLVRYRLHIWQPRDVASE